MAAAPSRQHEGAAIRACAKGTTVPERRAGRGRSELDVGPAVPWHMASCGRAMMMRSYPVKCAPRPIYLVGSMVERGTVPVSCTYLQYNQSAAAQLGGAQGPWVHAQRVAQAAAGWDWVDLSEGG